MDSDSSPGDHHGSGSESDFAFAFNDSNFSDRILRIEVLPDLPDSKSDGEGCSSIVDWARKRKRRREEIMKENAVDVVSHCEEQVLNCNMLDTEDGPVYENLDEEAVAMVEETPSGTGVMADHPALGGRELIQQASLDRSIRGFSILHRWQHSYRALTFITVKSLKNG